MEEGRRCHEVHLKDISWQFLEQKSITAFSKSLDAIELRIILLDKYTVQLYPLSGTQLAVKGASLINSILACNIRFQADPNRIVFE